MDLLEQYKQQNPEKFREQKSSQMTDEYGRDYSGLVAWVIRLSGHKIRDANSASKILLICCGIILLIAAAWWIVGNGSTANNVVSPAPVLQHTQP